jgi:hypothetical protein
MKKFYILSLFFFTLCYSNHSFAQLAEVVTELNSPVRLLLNGNDLYIAELFGGKILKIDITAENPTVIDVVTGLSRPYGLAFNGNDLYIAEAGSGLSDGKISKINITTADIPTTSTTVVVTGLATPDGLALNGNDLYISEYRGDKISKIDITAATPTTTTEVVTGLDGPSGIFLNGNILYIAEASGNKISKINISATTPTTATDVVTELNRPDDLLLIGNDLYISEATADKISKIDITADNPTTTDVVTGLSDPAGLALNGNDLYIAELSADKISKFTLPTLSVANVPELNALKVYPNPTSEFIQISGIKNRENYSIYSVMGSEIIKGSISVDEKINVKNYSKGVYFLKFDNGTTVKFVKE